MAFSVLPCVPLKISRYAFIDTRQRLFVNVVGFRLIADSEIYNLGAIENNRLSVNVLQKRFNTDSSQIKIFIHKYKK